MIFGCLQCNAMRCDSKMCLSVVFVFSFSLDLHVSLGRVIEYSNFLCHMKNGRQFIFVALVRIGLCACVCLKLHRFFIFSVLSIPSRRYIWDWISLSSQFFFINFQLSTSFFFSFSWWNKTTDSQWHVYLGRCCNAINQKIMFIPTDDVFSVRIFVCTTHIDDDTMQTKWELVQHMCNDHISEGWYMGFFLVPNRFHEKYRSQENNWKFFMLLWIWFVHGLVGKWITRTESISDVVGNHKSTGKTMWIWLVLIPVIRISNAFEKIP